MTHPLLLALLALPSPASAQVEKAADVRAGEVRVSAPAAPLSAPTALPLTAPALSATGAPLAAAPAAVPAAAPAAAPAPAAAAAARPEAAKSPVRDARGQLRAGAAPAPARGADMGRATFDGGVAAAAEAPAVSAVLSAPSDGPRLTRATERAPRPAPSIPFKQRVVETGELGVLALGMQLVTGLVYLALGAHAAFPALAGGLWMLFGGELIAQLRKLRGVVVGGWQASHDQKYRVDTTTGRMRDVRGHKYGEDRYDVYAPGPASRAERATIDALSFAFGLPWVVGAGPKAVALYAAGAAAVYAARRIYRRLRPEPASARPGTRFDYER